MSSDRRDDQWLRELLVRVLRGSGFRAVCRGEPATTQDLANRMSIAVMSAFGLGLVFSISDWLDASNAATVAIALLVAVALGVAGLNTNVQFAASLLVGLWLVAAAAQVVQADGDVLPTIGAPFLVTTTAVALLRAPRLAAVARSAPLVLPVTLSILVIPLFTNDMWDAVSKLPVGNLFLVGALTVLPLLVIVERRLRGEVRPRVALARDQVETEGGQRLEDVLVKLLPDEEKEEGRHEVRRLLGRWSKRANLDATADAVLRPLRRQLWRRALAVAIGLIVLATLYMGALAWAMIPVQVAERWVHSAVATGTVDVFGAGFDVPLGPYLKVSVLLGTLASAVLLASVIVDEDYARRLAAALLDEPSAVGVAAAAPYLAMREERPPKAVESNTAE